MYGRFTVNLGVYVLEVHREYGVGEPKPFVQEPDCCVRTRLGNLGPECTDLWWPADPSVTEEVIARIEHDGLPFLDRFASRDALLREWRDPSAARWAETPARIVMAIILAERGDKSAARELLEQHVREARQHPQHVAIVRLLAARIGAPIATTKRDDHAGSRTLQVAMEAAARSSPLRGAQNRFFAAASHATGSLVVIG